ncbi:MAG: DUF4367 domain-containing protein [Lachnospiraceae bacterium]|nr:DUF4367 domain-containing protein [Lachnospiraceae bacterium]MBQ7781935.1 DUF4367 domain-containing protein [Lachnospiraceae bacterium]
MSDIKKIEITDELLQKYVSIADKILYKDIPMQGTYEFSEKFESRMEKLTGRAEHSKFYRTIADMGRRVAIIILAVLVLGFTVTMSVEALREKFFSFIKFEREDGFWEWHFSYEDETEAEESYLRAPQYIPQGYTLVDYCHEFPVWYEMYEGPNGEMIMIDNQRVEDGMTMVTDSEYDVEEQIVIQGHDATLLTRCGDGAYYALFWFEKSMFYQVYTTIDVPKEEVIKVAENMK